MWFCPLRRQDTVTLRSTRQNRKGSVIRHQLREGRTIAPSEKGQDWLGRQGSIISSNTLFYMNYPKSNKSETNKKTNGQPGLDDTQRHAVMSAPTSVAVPKPGDRTSSPSPVIDVLWVT
ncbi:hypothetical protein ABC974_08680 [Sphingomonas oligophenolica]|uniref:Uncharacterized protein n=1 Tax=Sphingomonas oligophenolica TaxID=301154 RepID=A0ABU9Y1L0_9SPHN